MARPDLARSANLTREETTARAASVTLDTVHVELDLRGARDVDARSFASTSTLTFRSTAPETWIDFIGESVDEVVVNGDVQPVAWDGARIRVTNLQGHNIVTIRAHARFSTTGEGLHRFTDPVDGEVYLYTQYEPADSRRAYACFEQPDLKARWLFEVTAPAEWEVLSNGAETERVAVPDGVRVSFRETPPLSSYITAVAAGPYRRVQGLWRAGERRVPLGVLCRASLATHLDAEEILDITRRGLDFFTEAFAFDYPWGKYDQIFVPEYNLGAMENPGLVTFTEGYVFRGASTLAQREARANTILHEMAHMWFGDLATMRWWDDLWLKESFADFMGSHVAAAAAGYADAWVSFASRRKGWAYEQDQLPTTHPIVADITDLEAAKLNFDGITYAKGASVLKQLVAYVGEEAFFRAAQRYFAEHAYDNTTLEDLLRALEGASGRDLRTWSDAWLQTTGMSELRVERGAQPVVVQTDPRPHRITVGLYAFEGQTLIRRAGVDLDIEAERTAMSVPVLPDADLIVPNDDDRTYAKVRLDARSTDAVARGLSSITDRLARSVIWAALWNAVRDAELPVGRYLEIVTRHAPREDSVALLADVIAHTGYAIANYVGQHARPALAASWLATAWEGMRSAAAGSDSQLAWARAVGGAAAFDDARAADLRAMLDGRTPPPDGLSLDPDLRWGWVFALSATGHMTTDDLDAELRRDRTATGHASRRAAGAARPDASVRAQAWRDAWSDPTLTNDHLDATISGIRAGGRRDLIERFDEDYFDRIRSVWDERSIEIARRLVAGLFPASPSLDLADQWLRGNADAPGALRRIVVEQRDRLARALRVRAAQSAG